MHGLGDNLHQRAIVRQLMRHHNVWLESSWVAPYHDLVDAGLKVVRKPSGLRTQTKNAERETARFVAAPPRGAAEIRITYTPSDVRSGGSVLAAMCASVGCDPKQADFRLPVAAYWQARADQWLARWRPRKPLLFYRPLVDRTEWGGCPTRNPDHAAYATLFRAIRDRFFVVSIADLAPGKEWIVGWPCAADAVCHAGELEFETLAALFSRAAMVFASPGFSVVLAQAVGTPVVCVFGGYENSRSFSIGARHTPTLGIDPIEPCQCFSHDHACRKTIDLPVARARLMEFADRALASRYGDRDEVAARQSINA
jgi:hypothetical protein